MEKERETNTIEFLNKVLSIVCKRIYNCEVLNVSETSNFTGQEILKPLDFPDITENGSSVFQLKNGQVEQKFLFNFIVETVIEKYELILMDGCKTEEQSEFYADEIYRETCEKFQSYLKDKLQIDVADIIALSSLPYEGAENKGNMFFALDDIPDAEIQIRIEKEEDKVSLKPENWRKIRKLLEISEKTESNTKDTDIFGMLLKYEQNEWKTQGFSCFQNNQFLIRIAFTGHMAWEMYLEEDMLVKYTNGRFSNELIEHKEIFFEKMNIMREDLGEIEVEEVTLWPVVESAIGQKHGTILIILFDKEVNDVCGTLVNDVCCTDRKRAVRQLTAVDGAVFINASGEILAYGVILNQDNAVEIKKNPERGSRYHSAKRYIATCQRERHSAIAVIVSEDGLVDFYSTKDAEKELEERA